MSPKAGQKRKLADGHSDNLKPLKPLDLSKVRTVNDLVTQMRDMSFGARDVGEAADVLFEMVTDKDCFVVLTLSGAMTVAKMGLVICDLIDNGMVNAVVSTGALMAHGLVEAIGMSHFKYEATMDDRELYYKGYDRVFDTIELEKSLGETEIIVESVLNGLGRDTILSSHLIHKKIGEYLEKNTDGRGILKSAFQKDIPVFVPAFTDSEMGLAVGVYNRKARLKNEKLFTFDPFLDLEHFTETVKNKGRIGIFTIGGGVPRNWAQQVGPYLDIISHCIEGDGASIRYRYGVRVCPEPPHLGGLSGCTYSEGISWGKFVPRSEGGRWAEVYADATIAVPLIVKAVLERMEK